MNAPSPAAPVAVESLSVITYQQQPVVTTELLAQLYGTDEKNIQQNFARNTDRFVDGKHFIKLEGEALRDFKKSLTLSEKVSEIPRQTRNLLLWTERGAARHAKMLDTEQAWEVFEKLEDCYFAVKAVIYEPTPYAVNPADKLTKDEADTLRRMLREGVEKLPKDKQAAFMIKGWSKLKAHFGVTYREIPRGDFSEAVSLVARYVADVDFIPAPTDALQAHLSAPVPTFANRRWMIVVAPGGGETARPLAPEDFITNLPTFPAMLRDPGFQITNPELIEILSACTDRMRGKIEALTEKKMVLAQ
jgi:hypothetical protein